MLTITEVDKWSNITPGNRDRVRDLILKIESLEKTLGDIAISNLHVQHKSALRIKSLEAKILEARDCLKSLRIDYKTQPMTLNWIDSTIISLEEML